MALIKCDECGKQISDKAKVCPSCGLEIKTLTDSLESTGKNMQNIGCALTLFITIPILLFFMVGC